MQPILTPPNDLMLHLLLVQIFIPLAALFGIFTLASGVSRLLARSRHRIVTFRSIVFPVTLVIFGLAATILFLPPALTIFDTHPDLVTGDSFLDAEINRTHPALLKNLRSVSIISPQLYLDVFALSLTNSLGVYVAPTRSIYISEYTSPYPWRHELGHHLWYYHLTNQERDSFISLHERDINVNFFPSAYAMTDAGEDFAESFQMLISESSISERRSEWMENSGGRAELISDVLQRLTGCASPSPSCAFIS